MDPNFDAKFVHDTFPEPAMPACSVIKLLKGQKALVTGASSGIGKAVAIALGNAGADVMVNYVTGPEDAEAVAAEIRTCGSTAIIHQADVSKEDEVVAMFDRLRKEFGTIDILINNAGIARSRETSVATPTHEKTDEDWHKMLATHLDSTFYCTREALKVMIPKQSGRIINLGSIAGTTGLAFASDYCAAKGGIISFTKSVAREVVPLGVLVNCIAPGFIDTPMTSIIDGEMRKQIEAITPIGRFGQPSDIAAAALFLACEDSKFMVGQVISPNGGYVI